MNLAPTRGFEAAVGNRTDVRVWGFLPLPDDAPSLIFGRRVVRLGSTEAHEEIVVYCKCTCKGLCSYHNNSMCTHDTNMCTKCSLTA